MSEATGTEPTAVGSDIYEFQSILANRLMGWAGLSVVAGSLVALRRNPFWRAFGLQTVGWGAVDAAIALAGERGAITKAAEPDSQTPQVQAEESEKLRKILLLNAGLDVAYVAAGLVMARKRNSRSRRGTGWAIAVQGAFLLAFDLAHAVRLEPKG